VCVIGVVALGWPEASWKPYHPVTWQEVAANLMLVQNLWTGHSVLTPLWSLPYEVEMYLVLPVAYLIARRRDGLQWMLTLVVASTLAGYAFGKLKHGHMNLAAYVPCFLAGVACYLVRDRVRPRISGRWWPVFVIGAVSAYCVVHTVSDRLITDRLAVPHHDRRGHPAVSDSPTAWPAARRPWPSTPTASTPARAGAVRGAGLWQPGA
jgi:peptidoglycan/LPS O-acetylase OafA/YrhL